jgi:hypothetical protein
MSKPRDRIVSPRPDGTWANKRNDAGKASGIHDSQAAAIQAARGMPQNSGGGALTVQSRHGVISSKDTIPPGNDPNPPKD